MTKRNKDWKVTVRLSTEELAALDDACMRAGVSRSDAIRLALDALSESAEKILSGRPGFTERARNQAIEQLAFQISKVGANLNQIARNANATGDSFGTAVAVDKCRQTLEQLRMEF